VNTESPARGYLRALTPDAGDLPPRMQLMLLISGKRIAQVIYALAKLNVADHLAGGPQTIESLAELTDTDADSLYRVLRCASAVGVFAMEPDGRWALTPAADGLRTSLPDSLRDLVVFGGEDFMWRPYGEIVHSVRTGEPAFDKVFGMTFWKYLEQHPDAAEIFDRGMTGLSRGATRLAGQYDFGRFGRVADVGGGEGFFLAEILKQYPSVRGVLLDRPAAVAGAPAVADKQGVTDRMTVVAGDFFEEVPPDCDAYVLKAVLHDWRNEEARRILQRVRAAMGDNSDARLLVFEMVVGPPNKWDHAPFLDIDMLVKVHGRERTLPEWTDLFQSAGFDLVGEPATGHWACLEGRPR
jgi:multifunctional cyclase/dehydratase/O-methyltransferase